MTLTAKVSAIMEREGRQIMMLRYGEKPWEVLMLPNEDRLLPDQKVSVVVIIREEGPM